MTHDRCLIVFVRYPEKGRVKSRLARNLDEAFVCELYGCFVDDLLETMEAGDFDLRIACDPPERGSELADRFGSRFTYLPQEGPNLGERMRNAFLRCFGEGYRTAVLIGSDCPDLTVDVTTDAFLALESGSDAALGPAFDGGYYLIGFRQEAFTPETFDGMIWGTDTVFADTLNLLVSRGYHPRIGPMWRDIDERRDLTSLVAEHADGPFTRSRTMRFLKSRKSLDLLMTP